MDNIEPPNDPMKTIEGLIFLFLIIYLALPYISPIFEFLADIISYIVIFVIAIIVGVFIANLIIELCREVYIRTKKKLSYYDPRIGKDLEF